MTADKTIVIALGGNAILQPGQKGTAEEQLGNVESTADQIAELISRGYRVVVTHGNGPQVGAILIQQEAGHEQVPPMPLDVCGAQSQGQIGYMLQQSLGKMLAQRSIERPVVTVVTQMVVALATRRSRIPPSLSARSIRKTMHVSACSPPTKHGLKMPAADGERLSFSRSHQNS